MTGVFLQARLDSSRLPNKALLELGGKAVIEHAMRSLIRIPASLHMLLTDQASYDLLAPRARRCGFGVFAGPPDNVLERYVIAARETGVDLIVRATGDNPLVSWELARMALARSAGLDYFGFDGPPLGTGVEIARTSALAKALRETRSQYDREHVTPYLYRNPDVFRVVREPAPRVYCLPSSTVTLDTPSDYARLCALFDDVYSGDPIPALRLVGRLRDAADAQIHPDRQTHDNSSRA